MGLRSSPKSNLGSGNRFSKEQSREKTADQSLIKVEQDPQQKAEGRKKLSKTNHVEGSVMDSACQMQGGHSLPILYVSGLPPDVGKTVSGLRDLDQQINEMENTWTSWLGLSILLLFVFFFHWAGTDFSNVFLMIAFYLGLAGVFLTFLVQHHFSNLNIDDSKVDVAVDLFHFLMDIMDQKGLTSIHLDGGVTGHQAGLAAVTDRFGWEIRTWKKEWLTLSFLHASPSEHEKESFPNAHVQILFTETLKIYSRWGAHNESATGRGRLQTRVLVRNKASLRVTPLPTAHTNLLNPSPPPEKPSSPGAGVQWSGWNSIDEKRDPKNPLYTGTLLWKRKKSVTAQSGLSKSDLGIPGLLKTLFSDTAFLSLKEKQ